MVFVSENKKVGSGKICNFENYIQNKNKYYKNTARILIPFGIAYYAEEAQQIFRIIIAPHGLGYPVCFLGAFLLSALLFRHNTRL